MTKHIPLPVRRRVGALREGLIRDIAGRPEDLTSAQAMLIEKTVCVFEVTLMLEAHVREHGAFRGTKLDPILAQVYIGYVNALRMNLKELGINRKAGESLLSPLEIAAEIDAGKAREEAESGPGIAQGKRSPAGRGKGKGRKRAKGRESGPGGEKGASRFAQEGRSRGGEGQGPGEEEKPS